MYRVMIVDDENKIRQGLTWLIDWTKLECEVVYSAKNGEDAIANLEEYQPQIILTDIRMPKVNGLELAKYIYEARLAIEVIVLTGYADFEYSRQAIKYNVRDFILKPTRHEELEKAIVKTIDYIQEREKVRGSKEKNLELVLYKMIHHITLDQKEKVIFNQLNQKGFQFYSCISVKVFLNTDETTSNEHYLFNYYRHIIRKCIKEVFKDMDHLVLFPGNDNVVIYLFDYDTCVSEHERKRCACCGVMMSIFETFEDIQVKMGISLNYKDIQYMAQAYEESMAAIESIFYDKEDVIFTFRGNHSSDRNLGQNKEIEEAFNVVGEVMASGDSDKIEEYIHEVLRLMKDERLNPEAYRHYAFIILEFLAKIDPENVSAKRLQVYKNCHVQITGAQTSDEINDSILGVFNSIKKSFTEGSKHRLVNEANDYISSHIDKNISLQDVAKSLHVNSSYLSRLYKKVTNKTLTFAITTNKVEFAKNLLITTDQKVYDIARAVGIEDAAYFSQLFRKHTGCNPSDYRSKGRIS
ncbi:response regulator transcription factor [Vallitalea okinawensis]|uniref:response regulator transcription factor n=1 Tax=Vallitalea okinawensis TaxID=2078660 RepID=UPI000CFDF889|nr:response regulator [Vallitalea okinawensis]